MLHEQTCEKCLAWMLHDKYIGWLKCLSCSFMKKGSKSMISLQELMDNNKYENLSDELKKNSEELLKRVNLFRTEYGKPMYVVSGYRTPEHNTEIKGAKNSAHCQCQAIDFKDVDGKLKEFIVKDPEILVRCDLYMEHPDSTPSWVHLQSRVISSGNRIFKP